MISCEYVSCRAVFLSVSKVLFRYAAIFITLLGTIVARPDKLPSACDQAAYGFHDLGVSANSVIT